MDQVRGEIAAMAAEENATRVRLKDGLQAALKGTTLTFTLTSALALALLFGVHLLSERSRKAASPTRRLVIDDAPQHGRCGDCDRRRWPRHLPEPGGRDADRMGSRRGSREAARAHLPDYQSEHRRGGRESRRAGAPRGRRGRPRQSYGPHGQGRDEPAHRRQCGTHQG